MIQWRRSDPRPQTSLLPGPVTVKQSSVFRHHAAFKTFRSSLVKGKRREQRFKNWNAPTKSKRGIRATVAMARRPNGRTVAVELRS